MHARGGLFGDAANPRGDPCPERAPLATQRRETSQDHGLFIRSGGGRIRHLSRPVVLQPQVHQQRGVTAIVEDQIRARAVRPEQCPGRGPPILLERLALPREHRDASGGLRRSSRPDRDRGGGMVLRGKDVARSPAERRAELAERFDQDRRLHRHVQRARDARPGQGPLSGELLAQRHQAGHFMLGQTDFVAAEFGKAKILDPEIVAGRGLGLARFRQGFS